MENVLSASNNKKKSLKLVLVLTSSFFVVQIFVGLKIGSLAVISDAGHMLIDVAGLVMALLAISFSQRPATPIRTYGFYRAEILASLLNSIFLILLAVFILAEAFQRIIHPTEVSGFSMIIIASIGLGINLLAIRILAKARIDNRNQKKDRPKKYTARIQEDLNLHGAYLEVLADTVGSAGVILAGIIIQTTGFYLADALISIGIVALILPRIWLLLKRAIHILIEGTPAHLRHEEIKQAILRVKGVTGVFDLHIWTISSGIHSLSAHVVVIDNKRAGAVLQEINSILEKDYDISHATIQVEPYHESTSI
jgi:cobalt-zinc-cadmium efflux system protein